jgi:hypothetical protein
MMRASMLAVLLMVTVTGASLAQEPGMRQRQRLQQQVMTRFMQNVRSQAGLTEEQFERLREIVTASYATRREIQQRERELWRALEGQMRPGVAADDDSVNTIIDGLIATQAELVQLAESDQQAYAEFLSPVQRAQLFLSLRRLQNSIQQVMQRRGQGPPGQTR